MAVPPSISSYPHYTYELTQHDYHLKSQEEEEDLNGCVMWPYLPYTSSSAAAAVVDDDDDRESQSLSQVKSIKVHPTKL